MIAEVIVVEGKSDIDRVRMAVDADCIATEGYTLRPAVVAAISAAYQKRGLIILTDPDGPGERIRKRLSALFPEAKHAFVPKEEARTETDVGIEDASPEAIRRALSKAHAAVKEETEIFTVSDMLHAGLIGDAEAAKKRDALGAALGIGYGNARTFLKRLNRFGITREEWEDALRGISS